MADKPTPEVYDDKPSTGVVEDSNDSNDEKTIAQEPELHNDLDIKPELVQDEGYHHQSAALNIVENPLKVIQSFLPADTKHHVKHASFP
jgi:hypothetical protein